MNELLAYRICVPFARVLPRPFTYWVGLRIADRFYARDHAGRAAVVANLRQIFAARGRAPGKETLEGFARKTYQYFGKNLVDFFRFSHLTRRDVDRLVSLEQLEHLERAHAEGHGVIVVTAHFGNWELGGGVVAALGYPLNAVVLPQRLDKLNRLFQEQRKRHGLRVIQLGRNPRSLIRCLRKGELVALLADRDFSDNGTTVKFFGREARMPRGPAWLAMKTRAPIVPTFIRRAVDDTFTFRFHPPIRAEQEGSEEAVQSRICAVLEKEIGAHPNQWFLFEDFWQTGARTKGASHA